MELSRSSSQSRLQTPSALQPGATNTEIRLYGLHKTITIDNLKSFLSNGVNVLSITCHPNPEDSELQWAQVFLASEQDVQYCLRLRQTLSETGIILTRAPGNVATAEPINAPASPPSPNYPATPIYGTPVDRGSRSSESRIAQPLAHTVPPPRNLYVMGLPLDLTQLQFKSLFASYGTVEHSSLLSQLDGLGRRRGFVLMSTHAEATAAMTGMHGRLVDGYKIDVSWALVQREAKHFATSPFGSMSNRVVHPPSTPMRREPAVECSVIVENLDSVYFPNESYIREIFSHFGTVVRATILPAPAENLQVLVQFEQQISAMALLTANGMALGGRKIVTRPLSQHHLLKHQLSTITPPDYRGVQDSPAFDPFGATQGLTDTSSAQMGYAGLTQLNAQSKEFVPYPRRSGLHRTASAFAQIAPANSRHTTRTSSLGSSGSGDSGEQPLTVKSKASDEMSKSSVLSKSMSLSVAEGDAREIWQTPARWCECMHRLSTVRAYQQNPLAHFFVPCPPHTAPRPLRPKSRPSPIMSASASAFAQHNKHPTSHKIPS